MICVASRSTAGTRRPLLGRHPPGSASGLLHQRLVSSVEVILAGGTLKSETRRADAVAGGARYDGTAETRRNDPGWCLSSDLQHTAMTPL